jgi:ELWxxDGT repeat protein
MLYDLNRGPHSSNPSFFTVFRSALFFAAATHDTGVELFKVSGKDNYKVPELVNDHYYGPDSSFPRGFTVINDVLYFSSHNALEGRALNGYITAQPGTTDPYVESAGSVYIFGFFRTTPESLTAYHSNVLLYSAKETVFGVELLKLNTSTYADPVRNAPHMVKDINPGVSASEPQWITPTSH